MRYRFSGVVTGRLSTLQLSASSTPSQQVESFAQVLLLDEFKLFTCTKTQKQNKVKQTSTTFTNTRLEMTKLNRHYINLMCFWLHR